MKSVATFLFDELKQATNGAWTVNNFVNNEYLNNAIAISTDSRTFTGKNNSCQLFIAIRGEIFDGHSFVEKLINQGIFAVCVDEKFYHEKSTYFNTLTNKIAILVVQDTTQAYLDLAKFYCQKLKDNNNLKIIGITGSCGKTSTKEMLKSILENAFGITKVYATIKNTNNHIGVPQNILNMEKDTKVAILELGTSAPGEIDRLANCCRPEIAIITMIGHGHLEELKSIAGVAEEKSDIFKYMNEQCFAVIPANCNEKDIVLKKLAVTKAQTIEFSNSITANVSIFGSIIDQNIYGSNIEISKINQNKNITNFKCLLPFQGEHQLSNALAACAVAYILNINDKIIAQGLTSSHNVGMRMNITENKSHNITIINDAYNANFESMTASIKWLNDLLISPSYEKFHCFMALGDMLELGEKSVHLHKIIILELLKNITNERIPRSKIYLIGDKFQESLQKCHLDSNIANSIKTFPNSEIAQKEIAKDLYNTPQEKVLFLKGSRGMKLELIEEYCK
ncbi:UDP-N-acetylmuramoyl-tripeptide--D-alanyl-D-alanine ligase [Lentisphaerota bacterium WC36G]|nr:UDP-N-acetylmuramoyl-tripeptide--D-alanyl-D-alanine ligase [Lentisphaerae bacterium WC36]